MNKKFRLLRNLVFTEQTAWMRIKAWDKLVEIYPRYPLCVKQGRYKKVRKHGEVKIATRMCSFLKATGLIISASFKSGLSQILSTHLRLASNSLGFLFCGHLNNELLNKKFLYKNYLNIKKNSHKCFTDFCTIKLNDKINSVLTRIIISYKDQFIKKYFHLDINWFWWVCKINFY